MRRIRYVIIGLTSFLIVLLTPLLQRVVALLMCGVLGFNSICTPLILGNLEGAIASETPAEISLSGKQQRKPKPAAKPAPRLLQKFDLNGEWTFNMGLFQFDPSNPDTTCKAVPNSASNYALTVTQEASKLTVSAPEIVPMTTGGISGDQVVLTGNSVIKWSGKLSKDGKQIRGFATCGDAKQPFVIARKGMKIEPVAGLPNSSKPPVTIGRTANPKKPAGSISSGIATSSTSKQAGSDQLELTTAEGCLLATQPSFDGKSPTFVEYRSTNSEACGESFKAVLSPDGKTIVVTMQSGESLLTERTGEAAARFTYTSADGKKTVSNFTTPKEFQDLASDSGVSKTKKITPESFSKFCDRLEKDFCDKTSKMSDVVGNAQLAVAASVPLSGGFTTPLAAPAELILGATDMALLPAKLLCFSFIGGDPPIPFGGVLKAAGKWSRKLADPDVARALGDTLEGVGKASGRDIGATVLKAGRKFSRNFGANSQKYQKYVQGAANAFANADENTIQNNIQSANSLLNQSFQETKKVGSEKSLTDYIRKNWFQPPITTPCERSKQTAAKPQTPISPGAKTKGTSYGDPHMITFDGLKYSFQTVGEFVLVKSIASNFEVQSRQGAMGPSISMNTAVAIRVGSNRVALYAKNLPDDDSSTPLRVNGKPTRLENGSLELPGGGMVQGSGSYYLITAPTGEQIGVSFTGNGRMDITPYIESGSGRYVGLLGNADGSPDNDLQTRSGKKLMTKQNSTYGVLSQALQNTLPVPVPLGQAEKVFFEVMYREFGDSWRIRQADSLFDYAAGRDTQSYTNRSFPASFLSLNSFMPLQLREAEKICRQAGVESELMEGCLFDVANTGDASFAKSAANALADAAKDRLVNELRNRIPVSVPVPVKIPGLPF